MRMRDRLRVLGRDIGASLDERSAHKAEERAQLAAQGQVETTLSLLPGGKCPFCGKLLKHVMGGFGKRRYAVCHHCGRNAYDAVGGVAAFIESQRTTALLKSERAEAAREGRVEEASDAQSSSICEECGYEMNELERRRCPRCGRELN
jgi:predicted amidophosphoribosyltransferase